MGEFMKTRRLAIMGLFVALMCVSAWIRIPIPTPIGIMPMTFQTAVAILAALLLFPWEAFGVMLIYTCLGLAGLPVFSNPGLAGLSYLASPTFGYLIGFILGSPLGAMYLNRTIPQTYIGVRPRGFLRGIENQKGEDGTKRYSYGESLIAGFVVIMVVFSCGIGYSWAYSRYIVSTPVEFATLLTTAIAILWLKDTAIAAVIAAIAPKLRKHIGESGQSNSQ